MIHPYIADVTNIHTTTEDGTCNDANDYIVINKNTDCPSDAIKISNLESNPQASFGQKCCLKVTGYSTGFWNSRYVGSSSKCSKARLRIIRFNQFVDFITSSQFGVLP